MRACAVWNRLNFDNANGRVSAVHYNKPPTMVLRAAWGVLFPSKNGGEQADNDAARDEPGYDTFQSKSGDAIEEEVCVE